MPLSTVRRDEFSAPFFDAAARGELLVRRCASGHFMPHSLGSTEGYSLRCPECRTEEITWVPAAGTGTLISWVTLHLKEEDGGGVRCSGLVELDEGPWMYALLDVASDAGLRVGQALRAGFTPTPDGEHVPAFRPV